MCSHVDQGALVHLVSLGAASRRPRGRARERPAAGLEDLRLGLSALEALPYNRDAARLTLSELCARHRLDDVIGLLT
jgi:hypothetical protein